MLRPIPTALLALTLAQPAAALSCAPSSVQTSFIHANEAEAQYVMAVGRVQLLPGERIPPPAANPNEREGYEVKGRFDGNLATLEGFETPASFPVTIRVECAGPWCGGVPLDRVLAFVERTESANVITEGPCPRDVLPATAENVESALACLRGETCEPGAF